MYRIPFDRQPQKCPRCASSNIEAGRIDLEALSSDVECHNCGFLWHETFRFVEWIPIEDSLEDLDSEGKGVTS